MCDKHDKKRRSPPKGIAGKRSNCCCNPSTHQNNICGSPRVEKFSAMWVLRENTRHGNENNTHQQQYEINKCASQERATHTNNTHDANYHHSSAHGAPR